MDSLTQFALGAAVSVAAMGRRTAAWKAALWGGLAGTLPDLDVLVDHGDAVRNMVLHRAESHSLFWLSLLSFPLAAVVARVAGGRSEWKRWWLALWLALVTHPLLDALTVYGTRLLLPFDSFPYGVGSVFIIDPLYTVPLLGGVVLALAMRGSSGGQRANAMGLLLSSVYLVWSVAVQAHVVDRARSALAQQGIAAPHLLVTPTPFNTVLWRVVAVNDEAYYEGFHSLLDAKDSPAISFERFDRGAPLLAQWQGLDAVTRLAEFSRGFYAMRERAGQIELVDLRMGQEPNYSFSFVVAEGQPATALDRPRHVSSRGDVQAALRWLWLRAGGERLPPPR
jgi:inner membrane protein